MADAVRVLHLEDDQSDAEQIRERLARDGLVCDWTRVTTAEQFSAALNGPYDLILADYALPGVDRGAALKLARERRPQVPFVFVSCTMGAEAVVQRLREGATDCVLKEDLDRLPGVVRRALREARERFERQRAEEEVRRLNADLERRVEQRTSQLAATNAELSRREAELADAKAFLETLLAASPSMVFRFLPDSLRMTYVSPNIGWLLGYSPDEAVNVDGFWRQIVHPEDRGRVLAALYDATHNLVTQVEQECRCRAKDGRYRWFFTLLRIEYDAGAHPVGVLGYALDIADRKEAEEQLREARAFSDSILEHLPAMVFVKHAQDLRYARFNRGAEELLGLDRADVIGKTDFDLFPAELARRYVEKDREVLGSGMVADIGEEIVATRGRDPRVLHTKKIPINGASGEPLYLLGISQDITERREAHEQVRIARLEAERASRAKSEFLSRMSHDLRTPLNAILGFAQILQMDRLSAEQADSVQQILRGGVHLLELIDEVLDIARIEAGQLPLSAEPVPVAEVLTQVADLVRPLGSARGISVTADVSDAALLHVRADRQRLTQVLMNLVSNAVKYNRDEGRVRVSCERSGPLVRLRVADTGSGIPAEKLALLFQPFERLGAEQTAIEGTGLGLTVSKGLTEAMGGRIGVESQVDVGTTFWVELPQADAPAPARAPESAPAASSAHACGRILYVEDNRSNVRLLERLLARRPRVTLFASPTGKGALEMVRTERPDLILLDLHLPDLSGEEVLRRLWADPETRRIPVAVLSADATPNQKQRMLAAGAVAYLTKPLDLTRLLQLLDQQLAPAAGGGSDGG